MFSSPFVPLAPRPVSAWSVSLSSKDLRLPLQCMQAVLSAASSGASSFVDGMTLLHCEKGFDRNFDTSTCCRCTGDHFQPCVQMDSRDSRRRTVQRLSCRSRLDETKAAQYARGDEHDARPWTLISYIVHNYKMITSRTFFVRKRDSHHNLPNENQSNFKFTPQWMDMLYGIFGSFPQ